MPHPLEDCSAVVCGIRYVGLYHAGTATTWRDKPVQDATLPGVGDHIHGSLATSSVMLPYIDSLRSY